MNIDDVLKGSLERYEKTKEYLDGLPELERQEIQNKQNELSIKIKVLLDDKGIGVSDISTYFHKDYKTKDKEVIDAFITVYTPTDIQKANSVITSANNMKVLYVNTAITKNILAEEFFEGLNND